MPDDFLFDPWGAPGEREPSAPSKERNAPVADTSTSREADGPRDPRGRTEAMGPPAILSGPRWRARAVPRALPVERSVPGTGTVAGTRPSPSPPPVTPSPAPVDPPEGSARSTPDSEAAPDLPAGKRAGAPLPTVDWLRAIAVPHLEAVAFRLRIARHYALLDDRLDKPQETIRFRLVPRPAPFDEPAAVPGAVLELSASDDGVCARFWLDPVAEEPAHTSTGHTSQLTEEWLGDVVVDFVARTLRRG